VRILIATQEPTISPALLDLCSVSIVHRFTSPDWLSTLQKHLAAASSHLTTSNGTPDSKNKIGKIFDEIVKLNVGEALLFSPSAMLGLDKKGGLTKLGMEYLKIRVRKRISQDGGKSVLALA